MPIRRALGSVFCLPMFLLACSGAAPEAGAPNGTELFRKRCAVCHGADGKGKVAKIDMTLPEWQKSMADEQVSKTIHEGREAKGMPSFKTALSDEAINAIIADAIRKFGGGGK